MASTGTRTQTIRQTEINWDKKKMGIVVLARPDGISVKAGARLQTEEYITQLLQEVEKKDSTKTIMQSYLCKNCKHPGHFARECPNDSVCNNCGQVGHMTAEQKPCVGTAKNPGPSPQNAKNNQSATRAVKWATWPVNALNPSIRGSAPNASIQASYQPTVSTRRPAISAFYWILLQQLSSLQVKRNLWALGYGPEHKEGPSVREIVCVQAGGGIVAGATASSITTPLDTIKTRLQVQVGGQDKKRQNAVNVVRKLIAEEGWKGLYRGLGPRFFNMSAWGTSMIFS